MIQVIKRHRSVVDEIFREVNEFFSVLVVQHVKIGQKIEDFLELLELNTLDLLSRRFNLFQFLREFAILPKKRFPSDIVNLILDVYFVIFAQFDYFFLQELGV